MKKIAKKAFLNGIGAKVPSKVLTNNHLEQMVDTSDEWITSRTGIKERHILQDGEKPSSLGVEASKQALSNSNIDVEDIDLLIVATNVSDYPIPGTAPFIADSLSLPTDTPFFDVKAGCTGFIYGLDLARSCLVGNSYENVLLVGIEALSRIVNWEDRQTAVLFGDGAGAAVLKKDGSRGKVLDSSIFGDYRKLELLRMEGGGTRFPSHSKDTKKEQFYLEMEGGGVFKSAVNMMKKASLKILTRSGYEIDDVDWIIPHQANIRIIRMLTQKLGVDEEKVIINLEKYANTSTATVPLALNEALEEGRIIKGDLLLLTAFGAGSTYGSCLIEW